ncbi:MAG: diguanylate cyclase, partial [Amphritea sp.]|nr:diguanylate cyclase [Amphritea sp.]
MDLLRFSLSSLRDRVLILTLGGFLITAITLTGLIVRYLQNETLNLLVQQQQGMIDVVVRQMDTALTARVEYLENFAATLQSQNKLQNKQAIQAALNHETHLHTLFSGGLVVLNQDAVSTVDYPIVPNRTGIDFSDRKHVQKVRATRQTVITRPLIGKGLQTPLFAINTPVLSDDGETVLGFIFGVNVLARDNLLQTISDMTLSDTGHTMIIDPNLELFVTDSKAGLSLKSYSGELSSDCIARVVKGIPSGTCLNRDGAAALYASDTIDRMGWIVIRTYPLSQANDPIRNLTYEISGITIVLLVFMGSLIAYLLKRQLVPLNQASRKIQAMADGDEPMTHLQKHREDEVGKLIIAFNQLHQSRQRYEEALRASEERYRLTMEATHTGIWSWDLQNDRISWNSECFSMLGYPDQAFTLDRQRFRDMVHPDDQVQFFISFMPQMLSDTAAEAEFRLKTYQGDWLWVQSRGRPILFNNQSKPIRIAGTHVNIDKQKQTEQLRLAATAFETSDAIMIVNEANEIIKVNNAFCQITGYTEKEAVNNTPSLLRSGIHKADFYKDLWNAVSNTGHWQGEIWNRRKDGEIFIAWLHINTLFNDDGTINQRVAVFSDITEKKRSEELIWKQANFDPLTGLPNRRMFMDRLEQEIRLADRSNSSVALMFLDLDRFKEVNDTMGHNTGDELLQEVAKRFKKLVRSSDTVARLGGDEFTFILPQIENTQQVELVAEKILEAAERPFKLQQQLIYISGSIGITLFPQDADNTDQLIQNADQAMYAAKESGRNQMYYFTPSMQEDALQRVNTVKELREAVSGRQFELHYQPIVDMQKRKVVKAEALIRWHHPERGLVMPDAFIPIADESGLILEIGEWGFTEALRQVKQWRTTLNPDFQISVNTSPAHFDLNGPHAASPERWITQLQDAGIDGSAISFEITEGLLMDTSHETRQKLLKL